MAELKNIRIAVSGIYDYALEEIPTLRIPSPGRGAPDWVEEKRLYKVYRPAAVLAAACPKFASLPLTHHHPKTPVDGVNFRDLAIGWTGEHPEVDYIAETDEVGIRSTCVLYDDEALSAYENGEVQLSPGYIAVFEWKKGTAPNGEEYDIVMKEITDVNHLALLPNGRGGKYAVVMDEAVKERSVFDMIRNRREVLDYGTVFDLVRVQTKDVKYEDGHVSHRKDGDYVKQGGEWKPVKNKKKDSDNEGMEKESKNSTTQKTEEHTDINSEEFKRWFEGSNVVDENGNPKEIDGYYLNLGERNPQFKNKLNKAYEIAKKEKELEEKYGVEGNALYNACTREELNSIVSESPGVSYLVSAIKKGIKPELKIAVRYGDIRPQQESYNYRDQVFEKGVSTLGSLKDYKPSAYYKTFFGDKPLKIIIGLDVGNKGADGEMLLTPATVIGDYKDKDKILKRA